MPYTIVPYPPPEGDDQPDVGMIDYRIRDRFGLLIHKHGDASLVNMLVFDGDPLDDELVGIGAWYIDTPWEFDFTAHVWERHQGGTVGYLLVQEAMRHLPPEVDYFRTAVIHPTMTKLLTRFFGFTIQSEYSTDPYAASLEWNRPKAA